MTKRVLILDDNEDNRQLLVFALRVGDYEIHQAERQEEAIPLIAQVAFDFALLDIELPDGDGLQVAREIRTQNPDIGLIMLSANDNSDRLEQARAIGADAYVVKPFNLPQVLNFIREFDRRNQAEMLVL